MTVASYTCAKCKEEILRDSITPGTDMSVTTPRTVVASVRNPVTSQEEIKSLSFCPDCHKLFPNTRAAEEFVREHFTNPDPA
ncbi:hypothetical protein JKA73_17710 [Myxococcus xanthus]|uniref:hypothetical protein n=1 Tax=Myxococcus xanthus TaxID=34 RepID=UPI0019173A38|nr:hypothetical protein [Myxococcus xanthus]QQR47772.1 hypothetical protein JKA73_17710 [Myxococcus xanthus]